MFQPLAIDYDHESKRLFWTDDDRMHGQKGIHMANMNGSNVETIIDSGLYLIPLPLPLFV